MSEFEFETEVNTTNESTVFYDAFEGDVKIEIPGILTTNQIKAVGNAANKFFDIGLRVGMARAKADIRKALGVDDE